MSVADLFDSLSAAPVLRKFVQYLIAFSSRRETAIGVLSGRFVGPFVPVKLWLGPTYAILACNFCMQELHM